MEWYNMSIKYPFGALEELSRQMSYVTNHGEIFRSFSNENYKRLIDGLSQPTAVTTAVSEIVDRQSKLLASMNIPALNNPSAMEIVNKKWETIARISETHKTPAIEKLNHDLMENNFCGLQAFVDSLNSVHIEAANLAFLKNNDIFDLLSGSLPKGLTSTVKSIHTNIA